MVYLEPPIFVSHFPNTASVLGFEPENAAAVEAMAGGYTSDRSKGWG